LATCGEGNVEQVFNLLRIMHRLTTCATGSRKRSRRLVTCGRAQVTNLRYWELCYWGLCYRIGSVSIGTGGPGAIWAPGGSCSGGIGAP